LSVPAPVTVRISFGRLMSQPSTPISPISSAVQQK
jgi:hypothetical protein